MRERLENSSDVVRVNGYLSIPEAARELGYSRHSIYRWIRDGRMAAVQTGTTLSVRKSEVKRMRRELAA